VAWLPHVSFANEPSRRNTVLSIGGRARSWRTAPLSFSSPSVRGIIWRSRGIDEYYARRIRVNGNYASPLVNPVRMTIWVASVLPQGEMFPNACLLPHHKCSRPTRVQPYTLSALPPKQAVRDARFPLRRSERAACVPVAFYESAGSLMSRSSRCRPDSLGWLVDPRTRLSAAFRRRTFSRRCSVRRCPSR